MQSGNFAYLFHEMMFAYKRQLRFLSDYCLCNFYFIFCYWYLHHAFRQLTTNPSFHLLGNDLECESFDMLIYFCRTDFSELQWYLIFYHVILVGEVSMMMHSCLTRDFCLSVVLSSSYKNSKHRHVLEFEVSLYVFHFLMAPYGLHAFMRGS